MAHELTWHTPHKVLLLTLHGNYTVENAGKVNQLITDELDRSKTALIILIDAVEMNRPYNFEYIRAVQTFMNHRQLKHIVIVCGDRLIKLAMLVIFNLATAHLSIFDDAEKAERILTRQLANLRP
jgi:hypothetical protein